jgi:hypothetical protein
MSVVYLEEEAPTPAAARGPGGPPEVAQVEFVVPTGTRGSGGEARWDDDIRRVGVAAALRWSRFLQAKLQYGFNRRQGPVQQGEQMVAAHSPCAADRPAIRPALDRLGAVAYLVSTGTNRR